MLTYDSIRKMVYEEQTAPGLTNIPDDFFAQAQSYIRAKEKLQKDDAWELNSAKELMGHLLELREKKIIIAALFYVRSGVGPDNMTPEERLLFDRVVEEVKKFQAVKNQLLKPTGLEILQDIPQFVAPDMKTYGPFKKGDIAALPEDVAKLFIEKGAARPKE